MSKYELKNIKISTQVAVLFHGANQYGYDLTKVLSEQGAKVIVIDTYSKEKKDFINKIKKLESTDFIDFGGVKDFFKTINKIDYLFYLQNTVLLNQEEFDSKSFLEETKKVEIAIEASIEFSAKMALVDTVKFDKVLFYNKLNNGEIEPYSHPEVQKYSEALVKDYLKKSSLNARIIRMPTLLSRTYDGSENPQIKKFFDDAVNSDKLEINGEGLDHHFINNATDSVYGLLRITFDKSTVGEIITLAYPKPMTSLSIAYKLLELDVDAKTIKFNSDEDDSFMYQENYNPSKYAKAFNWEPPTSLEETFSDTLKGYYDNSSKKWSKPDDTKSKSRLEKLIRQPDEPKETASEVPHKPNVEHNQNLVGKFLESLVNKFNSKKDEQGYEQESTITKDETDSEPFSWIQTLVYIGVTTFLLLLSYYLITPLAFIGFNGYRAYQSSKSAYDSLQSYELEEASIKFSNIETNIRHISNSTERLEWAFNATNQAELYNETQKLIFSAEKATIGAKNASEALQPLASYINEFEPAIGFDNNSRGITRNYNNYLSELSNNKAQITLSIDQIEASANTLSTVQTSVFPENLRNYVETLKTYNNRAQEFIDPFEDTALFLPEILGINGRQRYLVLFQNPAELRSTGGWLSSYAIIGVENGQIRQLDVGDVYNIDGQITKSDEPINFETPEVFAEEFNINEPKFSLSNWDPNFPTAARDAEILLQETEQVSELDGVIAVDTEYIKDLLDVWDGLNINGELITSENLDEKIFEIHRDFIPGEERKTDFIGDLSDAMLRKILSSDVDALGGIADTTFNNLEQKHILISMKNPDARTTLLDQEWSGTIDQENLGIPFAIEWNWGANKANLYVDRKTNIDIDITDTDSATVTYNVVFENDSQTEVYPQGTYENWHRVFIPEGADITNVSGFRDDEFTEDEYGQWKSIGGWIDVSLNSTEEMSLTYNIEGDISYLIEEIRPDIYSVDFEVFKQPGLENHNYEISVTYPTTLALLQVVNGDMFQTSNTINFNQSIENDTNLRFDLELK